VVEADSRSLGSSRPHFILVPLGVLDPICLIHPYSSAARSSPSPRHPPHQFSAAGAPPPRRTPSEHHRRPPPPPFGERPSELLFPSIDHRLLTPGSPSSCRTQPPSSTTTGATPPPLNTAARRRLRRLTVDPPFRCAPALSSLPGATPGPHRCSPTTPCHRRARHRAGTRAAHARCSGPRRPFASLGWAARPWPSRLVGRPRVAGRHAPWAVASGQFRPSTVRWFLNVFQSI
jgi:hypothetical protein